MVDPKDVESCETVGDLNGKEVKMLKTKGGFHIFVGKASPSAKDSVLVGASHRAIGLYKLGKQFLNFHPALTKSEQSNQPKVSEIEIGDKYEIFKMETENYVTVSACKYGAEVGCVVLKKEDEGLFTHLINFQNAKNLSKSEKLELADTLAKACLI